LTDFAVLEKWWNP